MSNHVFLYSKIQMFFIYFAHKTAAVCLCVLFWPLPLQLMCINP